VEKYKPLARLAAAATLPVWVATRLARTGRLKGVVKIGDRWFVEADQFEALAEELRRLAEAHRQRAAAHQFLHGQVPVPA